MFVSKVGTSCPTLGQLLASRILYALLVGETARNRQGKILYTELLKSWSTLAHVSPISIYMGSCRVFLAIFLWQHPIFESTVSEEKLTEFCDKLGEFAFVCTFKC